MEQLIIQPTSIAHWYALVNEAECICRLDLTEDIESYLVFLLMRFANKSAWLKSRLAIDFLQGLNQPNNLKQEKLKEVGDKCLLISGLFPQLTQRRRVNKNYFIDLGQSAYYTVSCLSEENLAKLYRELTDAFQQLRDVLSAIRTKQVAKS